MGAPSYCWKLSLNYDTAADLVRRVCGQLISNYHMRMYMYTYVCGAFTSMYMCMVRYGYTLANTCRGFNIQRCRCCGACVLVCVPVVTSKPWDPDVADGFLSAGHPCRGKGLSGPPYHTQDLARHMSIQQYVIQIFHCSGQGGLVISV